MIRNENLRKDIKDIIASANLVEGETASETISKLYEHIGLCISSLLSNYNIFLHAVSDFSEIQAAKDNVLNNDESLIKEIQQELLVTITSLSSTNEKAFSYAKDEEWDEVIMLLLSMMSSICSLCSGRLIKIYKLIEDKEDKPHEII